MLRGAAAPLWNRLEIKGNCCNTMQHEKAALRRLIFGLVFDFKVVAEEGLEPPTRGL
jgi:hypothetical protein